MRIVQICHFENDGDALYRLHEPSRHLARLPGVTAIDCHFAHRFLPDLAERADVLVMQFVNDWDLVSLCARRRALGKITIFEANDDFFDLQPWSPIAARWQDRTVQELYLQLLKLADGVQTSSDTLARRWRERGAKTVAVFNNHLSEIAALPPLADRPLTIGWAGSPGHFADWYHVAPHLQRWLESHPEIHLSVMTNELARSFFQLPPSRYQFTKFGSMTDYLRFLRTLDVGLAPLLPTNYNRGRSDVKFLEYASQGVVGIFADLEPYRTSVVPGETGLLFRTPTEMIQRLDRLRADPALRLGMRQRAYDYVRSRRMLGDRIDERLRWYRGLLRTPVANDTLPAAIERAAVREGNYLRLVPQEPEATLQAALQQPAAAAAPILERLFAEHPDYLAARQHWGRMLNDLGDPRALDQLTALRDMAPHRGQAWSELGRAWFRRNDFARAHEALDRAIEVDPHHLPSWQYLVRMMALTGMGEGCATVEFAVEQFPSCYPLGLLGIATYPRDRAVQALIALLDRFGSKFTAAEKPTALSAFRDAIFSAIQAAPNSEGSLALLRRACEIFPESARLAEALGAALLAAGETEEGYRQQAHALELRRRADIVRREYASDDGPSYLAMFAEHILANQAAAVEIEQPTAQPPIPASVDRRRDKAYRLYQSGDPSSAAAICGEILQRNTEHADSYYLLGAIALDAGQTDRAADLFQQTSRLAPDNAVYANALGEVLLQQGKQSEAEANFQRARKLRPDYDRVHNNLGRLMHMRGEMPAARHHFSEAVRINPNYAIAHNNLGAVCQGLGKLDEAAASFQRALAIRKDYPEAHFNLGTVRQALGDPIGAASWFREAIRLRPNYVRAHFHLGQVLELQRRGPEALVCFETAARLQPSDADIQRRLGDLLMQKPDWLGALAALERSAALQPGEPEPFARLIYAKQLVCDWRTYAVDIERLWADAQRQIAAGEATSVVPFQAITLPWPRDRLLAVARSHSDAVARHHQKLAAVPLTPDPSPPEDRARGEKTRLRVGYLSGDFYDHPISHLLYGMFGHHDRERFEIFAYSFGPPDNSVYRQRIAAEVEHFIDIAHLSVGDLARRIAGDGIDILIDLMGHTGINRLATFSLRPAPIQVSFLGMLGTMGADFIDYLITDRIVTPPEFAGDFTEKFVTMPHAYLIAEPEATVWDKLPSLSGNSQRASLEASTTKSKHGLPDQGFVFCSFNSTYKLEPKMFAVWMRILQRVPGSVLWLYTTGGVLEGNLRREAAGQGVDPKRIVFAPFVPRPEHLIRHRAADLFLDTRYYNAAATASLALQSGLPVLTCLGDAFASRVGASLLHAVGLPELVASDLERYEYLAVELATHPAKLAALREKLARNRPAAPLYDTRRFVRNLEHAFQLMHDRHVAGSRPAAINVVEDVDSRAYITVRDCAAFS